MGILPRSPKMGCFLYPLTLSKMGTHPLTFFFLQDPPIDLGWDHPLIIKAKYDEWNSVGRCTAIGIGLSG